MLVWNLKDNNIKEFNFQNLQSIFFSQNKLSILSKETMTILNYENETFKKTNEFRLDEGF